MDSMIKKKKKNNTGTLPTHKEVHLQINGTDAFYLFVVSGSVTPPDDVLKQFDLG